MISQWRENQAEATSYTLSELRAYAEDGWNLWESHKCHCVHCAGAYGYCTVGKTMRESAQISENALTDAEEDQK